MAIKKTKVELALVREIPGLGDILQGERNKDKYFFRVKGDPVAVSEETAESLLDDFKGYVMELPEALKVYQDEANAAVSVAEEAARKVKEAAAQNVKELKAKAKEIEKAKDVKDVITKNPNTEHRSLSAGK